jgi:hypothetical protein
MANKRFFRRKRKGRGEAKANQPFIQAESARQESAEGNSFFLPLDMDVQTKAKDGGGNDEHEREADAAADKVLRRKREEEKKRHKHAEEKKHLHHKEEDKHLHHKEEDKLQRKKSAGAGAAPSSKVAGGQQATGEGGSKLPGGVLHEMSGALGYDFSTVKIHTDRDAQEMSEQLGAQAFTHGADIYFNSGKYDPQSQEGKWLLAHELTHVVQQRGSGEGGAEQVVQRKPVAGISTPVPEDFTVEKKKEVILSATGRVKGVKVEVFPDTVGAVKPGKSADTNIQIAHHITAPVIKAGKIDTAGVASVSLIIRTTYREGVDPGGKSKFGAGTRDADKKAGNTSLRYHEGSHGGSAIDFVAAHPVPEFAGKVGMTTAEYNKAVENFKAALTAYTSTMLQANVQGVDCAGDLDPDCKTP